MGDVSLDTAPGAGQWLGRVYAGDGNGGCVASNSFIGLDDDRADLHAVIDGITTPHGTTAGQTGIGWGWYAISSQWRDVIPAARSEFQPATATTPNVAKVVVFMSDGEFNTAYCNGVMANNYGTSSEDDDRSSTCNVGTSPFDQALNVCDNLRDEGIRVYTIGFDLDVTAAEDFMQDCATTPEMAFLATTGADLQAAFAQIAADIAQLRLSR